MTKKILLVEDDDSLGETLKERLEREDYGVIRVSTVKDAGEALKGGRFDLAIIDVCLPVRHWHKVRAPSGPRL